MNPETTFPLITLRPALDAGNAWVALLLDAEPMLDNAALAKILNDLLLAETLAEVSCVATVDPRAIDPTLAADLPRDRLILRFPVAQGCDTMMWSSLTALRQAGFGLMVTGVPDEGALLAPDIMALAMSCPGNAPPPGLNSWLSRLPGPHLALGTTDDVCPGLCKFQWLAGHYSGMVTPTIKGDPTARSLLLKLLSLVTRDAESSEIEALIKQDANLAYKLLKLVNSVAFMPGRHIENFMQALVLLGRRQLQRWLMLLLFARPPGCETASPLLPQAAMRANLMEGLARRQGFARDEADHAFMIGMFSLLDRLFGTTLAEVIAPLNLADDVTQALVEGQGPFGALLAVVRLAEDAPMSELAAALADSAVSLPDWAAAATEAARWAVMVSKEA